MDLFSFPYHLSVQRASLQYGLQKLFIEFEMTNLSL